MGTDDFLNVSVVYGLDSQILANCFKAFAYYIDVPKKDWNKYHAPYKETVSCTPARTTEVCTVDRILREPYFEKTSFPAKVKEHSTLVSVLKKSAKKVVEPDEQIIIKSPIAIVKDLVTKNVGDEHIVFCEDACNIVSHPSRPRKQVFMCFLSGLVIIAIMVYAILVLVQMLFLSSLQRNHA
jgi:hypothetical protein